MENIPISNALNFIFSVFSRLLDFIASHPLVKWFVLIPICTTVFLCVAYFVLDLTHILDDYNAKNSLLYKGIKQYNKNLAEKRKQEEKEKQEKRKTMNELFSAQDKEFEREHNSRLKAQQAALDNAYKEYQKDLKRQYQETHPYTRTVTKYQDSEGAWKTKTSYRKRDDKQPMENGEYYQTFYNSVDTDSIAFKAFEEEQSD